MKADELWDRFCYGSDGSQGEFIAALHEYGALVRAKDAEMIRAIGNTWEADDQRIKKYACDYLLLAITKEPMP